MVVNKCFESRTWVHPNSSRTAVEVSARANGDECKDCTTFETPIRELVNGRSGQQSRGEKRRKKLLKSSTWRPCPRLIGGTNTATSWPLVGESSAPVQCAKHFHLQTHRVFPTRGIASAFLPGLQTKRWFTSTSLRRHRVEPRSDQKAAPSRLQSSYSNTESQVTSEENVTCKVTRKITSKFTCEEKVTCKAKITCKVHLRQVQSSVSMPPNCRCTDMHPQRL